MNEAGRARGRRRLGRAGWVAAWMLAMASGSAGFNLPPVTGELGGEFAPLKLEGAPKLTWMLQVRPGTAGGRAAEIAVEGAGTRIRGEVELSPSGSGRWKITEGSIDVAAWTEAVRSQLGAWASSATANGTVTLKGNGAVEHGRWTGNVSVVLENGTIAQEAQGWRLERVTFRGDFSADSATMTLRSVKPFEFGIGTIGTSRFGARNLFATGRVRDDFTVELAEARVEIAGGRVEIEPCVLALRPPALDVRVRIENVGLQDVAALVPAGLADAHGRIDGTVGMSWSEARGFQLGAGELTLGQSEQALVRLAPSPGFLTDRVPQHFNLLPAWLGPLARWFRAENPAYADMRRIELGQSELHVTNLKVSLTPAGDSAGRTALVTLTAQPVQPGGAVNAVTFAINVSGPLSEVLRLGFNQSFSIETR